MTARHDFRKRDVDPTPLKWSTLSYVFAHKGGPPMPHDHIDREQFDRLGEVTRWPALSARWGVGNASSIRRSAINSALSGDAFPSPPHHG
jgi:hypothetical protein